VTVRPTKINALLLLFASAFALLALYASESAPKLTASSRPGIRAATPGFSLTR